MFCHSDDEGNLGFNGFFNGLSGLISGNVDGRSIRLGFVLSLDSMVSNLISGSIIDGFRTALTDGNTGKPRCSPSTPGLTPPTILVPHASDSWTLAVACRPAEGQYLVQTKSIETNHSAPVKPWNRTLV